MCEVGVPRRGGGEGFGQVGDEDVAGLKRMAMMLGACRSRLEMGPWETSGRGSTALHRHTTGTPQGAKPSRRWVD